LESGYTDVKQIENWPPELYKVHIHPHTLSEKFAYSMVRFFRVFNTVFFRDKYTHHAVVLETVAAVPGMVAGMLRHFKSLRRMVRKSVIINLI